MLDRRTRLTYKSVWEALTDPEPEPPIMVDGLLREGSNIVIGGSAGVGKSLFCTQLGWCLSTGTPFLSMRTHRAYRVVYAQAEMGDWDVEERLRQQGTLLYPKDWNEVPFHYLTIKPWVWNKHVDELVSVVRELKCEVLILDPLSRIKPSGVSENDNDQMGEFLNEQINGLIIEETLKAIIIVHHFGKPGNGQGPMRDPLDMLRGASALRDWMENFIYVGGKRNAPDARLVFDKIRGFAPKDPMSLQRSDFVFRLNDDLLPLILGVLSDWEGHDVSAVSVSVKCTPEMVRRSLLHVPHTNGSGQVSLRYPEAVDVLNEYGILWSEP